jgi:hypothetical protein
VLSAEEGKHISVQLHLLFSGERRSDRIARIRSIKETQIAPSTCERVATELRSRRSSRSCSENSFGTNQSEQLRGPSADANKMLQKFAHHILDFVIAMRRRLE